jgi:sugar phosphate permease
MSSPTFISKSGHTVDHPVLPQGTRYRWRICALLFIATTVNYIDRHVFSILAPELQITFQWDEITYGYNVTDVFSKSSVSSVIGIGGTAEAMGGMLLAFSAGYLITCTHSYEFLFMIAAGAYAVALLLIHLLLPVFCPINVS